MNFGEALAAMEEGSTVTREKWERFETPTRMLWIQEPVTGQPPEKRYLCNNDSDGAMVPYTATNESILATDWKVVE